MFWFKRRARDHQKTTLEKVETRLGQLEQTLQELIKQGNSYDITIEELNIHDPSLDNLTFRFDKLDVKEVSGALNLGNNLGVNVHQNDKKKSKDKMGDDDGRTARHDGPAVNIVRNRGTKGENNFKKQLEELVKKTHSNKKHSKTKNEEMKIHLQPFNKKND